MSYFHYTLIGKLRITKNELSKGLMKEDSIYDIFKEMKTQKNQFEMCSSETFSFLPAISSFIQADHEICVYDFMNGVLTFNINNAYLHCYDSPIGLLVDLIKCRKTKEEDLFLVYDEENWKCGGSHIIIVSENRVVHCDWLNFVSDYIKNSN